jgi:hypothetical protein
VGYQQGVLKGLVQDPLLSLWDCKRIVTDGRPDRLLCVSSEGQGSPGLGSPGASSPFAMNLVLVSVSESGFHTLPLVHLDKGGIHCGKGAFAMTDLSDLALDGNDISVTLERQEDRCPEVPSALGLHWKLSGTGATPDKQSKKWIQQLAILPGPGAETQKK